jgi:3-hydroxyacyl-[acyl-carrier protein] dehydratase/trans-2-decenoyl-[acyl-carrier protein] isomerase
MRFEDFLQKTSFSQEEVLGIAYGLYQKDFPNHQMRLPLPPMLMIDEVTHISREAQKRSIVAKRKVRLDDWFFQCHFLNDPVQPGCLGVDAIWQLLGFYAFACGAKGVGRALGSKEIEFFGQIRPKNREIRFQIDVRRYQQLPTTDTAMVIGTGQVFVDDELIYIIRDAKVGTFLDICYDTYPFDAPNAVGGEIKK